MSEPNIPLAIPSLEGNASAYLEECIATNFVSSVGPFVSRFESEFAEYVGSRNAVACANGTAALHLAMIVAGIEAGDEVMVSDFTFVATVNPISYLNAKPTLVDADRATWNISGELVVEELDRRARTGKAMPKAVLPAHIVGLPVNIEPIRDACERHGVLVIEDAAEALGASYTEGALTNKQVGTVGRLGCFSFNGNKIITSGGGGMVVTDDTALATRARHLSKQARLPGPDYFHDEIGYNYRLTNLSAALGVAQLELLDDFVARKRAIADRYDAAFASLPGITTPPRPSWANPTFWLYSILIDSDATGVSREAVQAALAKKGIETRSLWVPAHRMPFYESAPRVGSGDVGNAIFAQGLSLPCSVSLSPDAQARVIGGIMGILSASVG